MNRNDRIYGWAGLWASSVFLGVLTGCTTYVEAPRPLPVYVAPPPPAEVREIVVTPPPPVETPSPGETILEIRSERDFYEPLNAYGHWVEVAGYGRCWVPDRVDRDWRPYTNGHWQNTEAGWYWVSDEPWGWATYHYGRWDWNPEIGWLWVPQTQWAPAWVSFHQGGGYTGWAPLHPSARIHGDGLEEPVRPDGERGLVFVEERHFLEPVRPATIVVNNTTIINQTVNITSIKVVNNTIINEGPHIAVIEKASGRTIEAVPVRELRRKQEAAVVAAHPIPPANQNAGPAAGRPEIDSRDYKAQKEAERRAAEAPAQAQADAQRKANETGVRTAQAEAAHRAEVANSQAQAETQRKANEAELKATQAEAHRQTNATNAQAQTQAEAQRKANEAEVKTAQAEAARRAEAAHSQAQAETQRKAKEAELKAAQTEAHRQANAPEVQAQAEAQRKANEAEVKTAQAEAAHRAEAAHSQAQAETQRKAKEVELKAAQADAERRPNGARENAPAENQKNSAARGEDAITSRIVTAFAANPALQGVHVTRSDGLIHLSGTVTSAAQKNRAGEIAQKIETSHHVQNDLTVRP